MGGQSVWMGWGSEKISWNWLSWFTNVTRLPTGTWIIFGLAPMAVRATVVPGGAEGVGAGVEGEDGDDPPQAPRARARPTTPATTAARLCDRARHDTRPPAILHGPLESTRAT